MRRAALALAVALLAAPISMLPQSATAAEDPVIEPNGQMKGVLPDGGDGWQKGTVRSATGALPLYSVATAEATYRKGKVEVVVGAGRSPSLYKAVYGSIKVQDTLPPNSKVEMVHGRKAIVTAYPEATIPLYQIQFVAGIDGIVMLTTRTGTLDDLRTMAQKVDFDPFPVR